MENIYSRGDLVVVGDDPFYFQSGVTKPHPHAYAIKGRFFKVEFDYTSEDKKNRRNVNVAGCLVTPDSITKADKNMSEEIDSLREICDSIKDISRKVRTLQDRVEGSATEMLSQAESRLGNTMDDILVAIESLKGNI